MAVGLVDRGVRGGTASAVRRVTVPASALAVPGLALRFGRAGVVRSVASIGRVDRLGTVIGYGGARLRGTLRDAVDGGARASAESAVYRYQLFARSVIIPRG